MGTIANLRVGDMEVYADKNDGAGERNLGFTNGGVDFQFERMFVDMMADEYGDALLDKVLSGNKLTIKTVLAEVTNQNIALAIPEGQFDSRSTGGSIVDSKVGLGRRTGYSLRSNAVTLRLHPRNLAPSNRDQDIYIWKAVSVETVEIPYKRDEQTLLEITFEALVDDTQPNGQLLGRVGDAAIS